jgi:hypothetical protein
MTAAKMETTAARRAPVTSMDATVVWSAPMSAPMMA